MIHTLQELRQYTFYGCKGQECRSKLHAVEELAFTCCLLVTYLYHCISGWVATIDYLRFPLFLLILNRGLTLCIALARIKSFSNCETSKSGESVDSDAAATRSTLSWFYCFLVWTKQVLSIVTSFKYTLESNYSLRAPCRSRWFLAVLIVLFNKVLYNLWSAQFQQELVVSLKQVGQVYYL